MPFIVDQPEPCSCMYCQHLRDFTADQPRDRQIRYCLKHDPTISVEDRKRYAVQYEKLAEIDSSIPARKRNTQFENLFGESDHGEEGEQQNHDSQG